MTPFQNGNGHIPGFVPHHPVNSMLDPTGAPLLGRRGEFDGRANGSPPGRMYRSPSEMYSSVPNCNALIFPNGAVPRVLCAAPRTAHGLTVCQTPLPLSRRPHSMIAKSIEGRLNLETGGTSGARNHTTYRRADFSIDNFSDDEFKSKFLHVPSFCIWAFHESIHTLRVAV